LGLAGCNYNRTPNFTAETPPWKVPADYRQQIAAWAQRYYVEPASVRFLGITDPVLVRATPGAEIWLVCAEIDARERGGPYMGPRRIAFGLAPGVFSGPMERNRIELANEDCDAPRLAWREWRPEPGAKRRRRS
jgi:hypothetical protein